MRIEEADIYVCPATSGALRLEADRVENRSVLSGKLVGPDEASYPITDGIPNFVFQQELPASDVESLAYYEREADNYDSWLPMITDTFGVDEVEIRTSMISGLNLTPDSIVLETGCGTGRDSALIARQLGPYGKLYLQEISPSMLRKAVDRMTGSSVPIEFAVANACYLPFPDNYFDACYHYGGLNTFGDVARALREMTRVTKAGGKIVVGDEGVAPWLRATEYGRVLLNANPNYHYEPPLAALPAEARNVALRWIIGAAFYVIDYEVGLGDPMANFDIEIPGPRGGTLRTRYYGGLEAVTPEAKEIALRARSRSGKSMHRWLSDVVSRAAREELVQAGGEDERVRPNDRSPDS